MGSYLQTPNDINKDMSGPPKLPVTRIITPSTATCINTRKTENQQVIALADMEVEATRREFITMIDKQAEIMQRMIAQNQLVVTTTKSFDDMSNTLVAYRDDEEVNILSKEDGAPTIGRRWTVDVPERNGIRG